MNKVPKKKMAKRGFVNLIAIPFFLAFAFVGSSLDYASITKMGQNNETIKTIIEGVNLTLYPEKEAKVWSNTEFSVSKKPAPSYAKQSPAYEKAFNYFYNTPTVYETKKQPTGWQWWTNTFQRFVKSPVQTTISTVVNTVSKPKHHAPTPEVSLKSSANSVTSGESVSISWESKNATMVSINPGFGYVPLSGSYTLYPKETTTYTITAIGSGGTVTSSTTVTVTVQAPPEPEPPKPAAPEVIFSADLGTIQALGSSTLSWTSKDATSVSIDNGLGDVPLQGSAIVKPTTTTTYTLTAIGPGGQTESTVTITVIAIIPKPAPTATFTASPTTIGYGTSSVSSTLTWSTTDASNVTFNPNIGVSIDLLGSASVSPSQTTTYTLTATGPGGTVSKSVIIVVNQAPPPTPAPTATLSPSPAVIGYGTSATSSTLSWTTTNASSVSFSPAIGSTALNGSRSVSPSQTTTYTLTATGPGGTITKSATVTVQVAPPPPPTPPKPTVSFSATPATIGYGTDASSSTLKWNTTNAASVSFSPSIGSTALNGSRSVSPSQTTTYTINVTGDGGIATATTTVTVNTPPPPPPPTPPKPTVSFSANPTTIGYGTSATSAKLTWSTTNATSVSFSPAIGSTAISGSRDVSPTTTTSYTLTAKGEGGTTTASVTITVKVEPAPPTPPPTDSGSALNVTSSPYNASPSATASANTTAFVSAMKDAVSKKTSVYVPAGTYKVNSLTLADNVSISGAGSNSWINGQVYLSTGNTLKNLSIGANGSSTGLVNKIVKNLTVDHVTFKGGGSGGVFRIDTGQTLTDSNFIDCVIESNSDGSSNGISIVDNGVPSSNVTNVTFTRLHMMSQPRISFEMIGRAYKGTRTLAYHHISIIDSVFETSGAETVSFDVNGNAHDLLVQGTTFKGSGTSTNPNYPWHQTLEFNGPTNVTVKNNTFYRSDGWWLNLDSANAVIENNTFDSTVDNVKTSLTGSGKEAMGGVCNGCTFRNNTFNMTNTQGYSWFTNTPNTTFSGNTFTDTRTNPGSFSFRENSKGVVFTKNTFIMNKKPGFSIDSSSSVSKSTTSGVSDDNTYKTPSGTLLAGEASAETGVKLFLERLKVNTYIFLERFSSIFFLPI